MGKDKIPRIRLNAEEFELIEQFRAIKETANEMDLNDADVKHGWIKNKKASLFFKNPNFGKSEAITFDFDAIFKDVVKLEKPNNILTLEGEFDRLVYTDAHIGMDSSDNGRSLYDSSWTKEDIINRLDRIVRHTLQMQKSRHLHLIDLGDFTDGFNGQTTRGGHALVQNMNNQQAFDCGLMFKISLVEQLYPHFDSIILVNINDDNHGGDFSYTINSALARYCEVRFNNVTVRNQIKFIDHEIIGNRCFVTMHGKDKVHMKYGFKPKLDVKQINQIIGYLNSNNLLNKGLEIIVEKGDSHQYLFDSSSSDIFKYYNFPSMSPQSNWVQTNFQHGHSGVIHFNYFKNSKCINELIF